VGFVLRLCVCFVDRCLFFCPFSFGHCVVYPSSIFEVWLPFWYLQTLGTTMPLENIMWYCVYILSLYSLFLNRGSIPLFLQLFVGGRMSYSRYLCLLAYSDVQHILCCVFALFFFVLCTICCQFLWIVLFWLPLRYSLTFIYLEQ
jgi:NhaP-type Na+/H+ or K+/H+ antiporter